MLQRGFDQHKAAAKAKLTALYTGLHGSPTTPYGMSEATALKLLPRIQEALHMTCRKLGRLPDAVDFGAGKGVLLDVLKREGLIKSGTGLDLVAGRDPWLTQAMWEPVPDPFDFAISTDALEHLPPDLVPDALRAIRNAAPHGFLRICTRPDRGLKSKEVLHLTVWGAVAWLQKLTESEFDVRLYRVEVGEAIEVAY